MYYLNSAVIPRTAHPTPKAGGPRAVNITISRSPQTTGKRKYKTLYGAICAAKAHHKKYWWCAGTIKVEI